MANGYVADDLNKITADEILENSVGSLNNRPNNLQRYGAGGMTPQQLKEWYDKLPVLAIEKINKILDSLGTTDIMKLTGAIEGKLASFGANGALEDSGIDADKVVQNTTTVNGHPLSGNVKVTKGDVDLGNVVDTGDSDTPVEGGTTKFTTGGAYTELGKKADKVSGATNGNFAGLDSAGNLTDSGKKASDFEPADSAIMKTNKEQTMTQPLTLSGNPTQNMHAAPKGYVDAQIASQISRVYKPAGSYDFAAFQQEVEATESNLGNVYNITDSFTTTSYFVEGSGKVYPAGTNVVVVEVSSGVYKFDVLSGAVDLTNYYTGAQCDEKYEPKDAAIMKTDEAQTMTAALKVLTPSADADAAPKKYVDDAAAGKMNKVVGATSGNVAVFDGNGVVEDSEVALSDIETKAEAAAAHAQKIDKLTGKTGYIPIFDSNGNIISSDLKLNDPTAHHYTVRWDMKNPQMERLNDAVAITTDTSKFLKYKGTSVVGYNNPFDNIYPWSGRKLCNVSINAYRALTRGQSLTQCISYYENETGFSWNSSSGVWVYTPEFWGKSWIEGGYQYFDVTDKECYGYTHYPERIEGRWHGSKASGSSWGITGDLLLPLPNGIPVGNISHKDMVKLARNYRATVDTIESLDANIMLYLVEFAYMNCQEKIGYGVTNSVYLEAKASTYLAYNYSPGVYESNNGGGNTLKVRAGYEDYFIPGAVIDIPWAGDQRQFRRIVSVTSPGFDESEQWFTVTLDQATGRSVWYDTGIAIRGMANVSDENIGSKSGYIGANGKCIAYYRGQELWGNRFSVVLGCSNQYGKISYDKAGITYPEPISDGYIANTGLDRCRVNAALGATAVQSTEDYDSNTFVSDYCWKNPDPTKKTILLQGGSCTQYSGPNGLFCQSWDRDFDFVSPAHNSARPCLIKP